MSAPAVLEGPRRGLDDIDSALLALRAGKPVFVVDDEQRENEGDIVLAAEYATPEWIGWTIRHTSGVLCAPMPGEIADRLNLPPMVRDNEDPRRTAYTVSVDARHGTTTGISATERALTLRVLAEVTSTPDDLIRPGHVFPLRARPGGVLERAGHTEAAVDLCRMAGLTPVGVISEVVGDDGEPLRLADLRTLAALHDLPLISIAALVERLAAGADGAGPPAPAQPAARVRRAVETRLPTDEGTLRVLGYRDLLTGAEHLALLGPVVAGRSPRVRIHSECLTGDALGSRRCDCGPQLNAGIETIAREGGALIYLRGHEGRGIGLLAKLQAYALQDSGLDTVAANVEQGLPVDAREYGAAAAILRDLGMESISLLTNNPAKVEGLRAHGIEVRERIAHEVGLTRHNLSYLVAKRDLMGHELSGLTDGVSTGSSKGTSAGVSNVEPPTQRTARIATATIGQEAS